MTTTEQLRTSKVGRRRFLAGAALGAAGLGLAACGGDSDDDAAAQATPTALVPRPSGELTDVRDALLPPVADQREIDLTLAAEDATVEIAAGVQYKAWTFGGLVPSPVIHMRQGDTMNFTLVNNGALGHSMDFHAAHLDWKVNYRTIEPGESLDFTWTAEVPGDFMYHCGTPPVLHHIGNGMYGAIIVEPEDGYPEPADREFWLVQSEFYLQPTSDGMWTGSMDKMLAATPDYLAWNGAAFQYRDRPLQAKVDERVRLHVVNCGPTLFSAFHVIGAMFEVTYVDGNPRNPLYGLQTHTIAPGGGAACDLVFRVPGTFPVVSHSFAYTELGVVGLIEVTE